MNEQLYTTSSKKSAAYFRENEADFEAYHQGFRRQAEKWATNPLDVFIKELQKEKYVGKTVADLGCGEGRLAEEVKGSTVLSYDIGKVRPHVIQADISALPLEPGSVDVAVFCLALMGTNFVEFLAEATRVLRKGGLLMIAEVTTRFLDLAGFKQLLGELGFELRREKSLSDYFTILILKKKRDVGRKKRKSVRKGAEGGRLLKACVYKLR